MACETVHTGQRFVTEMLGHIDCQAQAIGAYGYGALADPASPTSLVLTALLTIFVALFGLRLLSGAPIGGRDAVGAVLKIGIVLTLATSWPAWRTLGYDLVLVGPVELARTVAGASGLPGGAGDLSARMQVADDGIALLTVYGTGRNTDGTNRSDAVGDSFRSVSLDDQQGLAGGRIWFLAGVIGPLAIVKLGAGLLLALAPLMGGLLFFAGTRDLFFGWLRALFAVAVGALALATVHGVELAVLDPWVREALALRAANVLTPSAPTELSVIMLVFAAASFGVLFVIGRMAFFAGAGTPRLITALRLAVGDASSAVAQPPANPAGAPSRALTIADSMAQAVRREDRISDRLRLADRTGSASLAVGAPGRSGHPVEPLRTSHRGDSARRYRRTSAAGGKRDSQS